MSPSTDRTILVTGATGQQGGSTARTLLRNGFTEIRAMTRNPASDQATALRDLGADVVFGDFDDSDSLVAALDGVWGAFSVQNTWEAGVEHEEKQGLRFAELAREAGVEHFVYASVGSADRGTGIPHFENKFRIEERVRELGFPTHVVLRPVFFMENPAGPWFKPGILEGKLRVALREDTQLQMIAVQDIGTFGHLAFRKSEELSGESIDIAGDQLTMPEAAQMLTQAVGHDVIFEQQPIEEVRESSGDFAQMLEWFDAVGYDVDVSKLERRFGLRLKRFHEWAMKPDWS